MEGDIDTDTLRRLGLIDRDDLQSYLTAARSFLDLAVLDPESFDLARLERKPDGYARNLLFGDENLSLLAMVWAPGARTSVHDHHCSCCFGVLAGHLQEFRYRAIDREVASLTDASPYGPGFVRCMVPSGPNLHQMVNDSGREAISIHLYGFDYRTARSSISREYRIANP